MIISLILVLWLSVSVYKFSTIQGIIFAQLRTKSCSSELCIHISWLVWERHYWNFVPRINTLLIINFVYCSHIFLCIYETNLKHIPVVWDKKCHQVLYIIIQFCAVQKGRSYTWVLSSTPKNVYNTCFTSLIYFWYTSYTQGKYFFLHNSTYVLHVCTHSVNINRKKIFSLYI